MFQLNQLVPLKKKRKRIGRGGSRGGTSGKGHKGQKARSGAGAELRAAFEGGQMPLARRVPCRGFFNPFKKEVFGINLKDIEARFQEGQLVNRDALVKVGLIKPSYKGMIKILAEGDLTKKFIFQVDAYSKTAADAIHAVGGELKQKEN